MRKFALVALVPFLCVSETSLASAQLPGVEQVSILQLIVTPEKYDGQTVVVQGFLHLEFEGDELYLSENDYVHHLYKNGLWVQRDSVVRDALQNVNSRYVIVKGTFDAGSKGHMSLTSGTLKDISAISSWPVHQTAGP